jgi:hypothetical protein
MFTYTLSIIAADKPAVRAEAEAALDSIRADDGPFGEEKEAALVALDAQLALVDVPADYSVHAVLSGHLRLSPPRVADDLSLSGGVDIEHVAVSVSVGRIVGEPSTIINHSTGG